MAVEQKPFEISVAGYDLSLTLGKCACVLFRTTPDVDYLKVDISEESGIEDNALTVFNNQDLVRWLAGFCFQVDGMPLKTMLNGESFADSHGWNPAVVVKWEPTESETEGWLAVTTGDLEKEWDNFDEH